MIKGRKRRPQRNDLNKKGMEHLKRKNMTLTDTVPLWWKRMFNKRELLFFAATNGSPSSTALVISLQVCVAAVTGTPRSQEHRGFFSIQANKIQKKISQASLNLENMYRRKKFTFGVTQSRSQKSVRHTPIYTHCYGKGMFSQSCETLIVC